MTITVACYPIVEVKDYKGVEIEKIVQEVKDEDVDLDQKINHYTSVQMANNGNGMLIKGA